MKVDSHLQLQEIGQKEDCKIDPQLVPLVPIKQPQEVKDCISEDTILVLRSMSLDDSSLDSVSKHLLDWISLRYVCPACAQLIRNHEFYENITQSIKTAEKYKDQFDYSVLKQLIKYGLHFAFKDLQVPADCTKYSRLRIKEENRDLDEQAQLIIVNQQNGRRKFQQEVQSQKHTKQIIVIDLEEQ